MQNNYGWVSLHRELLNKSIWLNSTPEQKTILITIILMANHAPNKWEWKGRPFEVQPGQFITSLASLAANSGKGISIQNVRTALRRFENLEFLTSKATNLNRLITICNYSEYQDRENRANKQTNNQLTNDEQTGNKPLTPNNNVNNVNNDKTRVARAAVIYLNEKGGRNYDPEKAASLKYAKARIRADNWTLEDFKAVIDHKIKDWANNDKMRDFIRPSTLFNNEKGNEYLEAARAIKQSQTRPQGESVKTETSYQVKENLLADLKQMKFLNERTESPQLQQQITAIEAKLKGLNNV